MADRRDAILAELGVTMRWRLRDAQRAGPAEPAATPAAAETPEVERVAASTTSAADDRAARIASLDWQSLAEAVAGCSACGLCRSRKQTVFGVGAQPAGLMIIGEAPGAEEDARGEPFVGQAGRLLDSMLDAIGLDRERDIFIANVLKCRPPGNRNPEPAEVAQCEPFLARQIALVQPRLIVAMGRFAAHTLLATDASIASLRGRLREHAGVPLVVTYHPAYLLRNLPDKARAWEDLLLIRRTLAARS